MKDETFNEVVENQLRMCRNILVRKSGQYTTTEDRLHNFKVAAVLQNTTPRKALASMMAKHTVSIFDMCNDDAYHSLTLWNEKIIDHINYLLLLTAVVHEEVADKLTEDQTLQRIIQDVWPDTPDDERRA